MMGGGPADEEDAGTRKDESRIPRCRTLSAETQRASLSLKDSLMDNGLRRENLPDENWKVCACLGRLASNEAFRAYSDDLSLPLCSAWNRCHPANDQ